MPEPAAPDVPVGLSAADRVRLGALRYATNPESEQYLTIMRVFTGGTSGLMSDLSAAEVADRLAAEHGVVLDEATVEERLSSLVDYGNLARSPRESSARTIEEYLRTRARFQLTSLGELAHRLVEELLGATDSVREVSTEMLGAIESGLRVLAEMDAAHIAAADPDELSSRIGTVFAQHRSLVESTRDFYSYLGQVLGRYDLGREDFRAFKTVLIDYLRRFVEEIARHMPQIAELLTRVQDRVPALVARANDRPGLVDVAGHAARRNAGLALGDWQGLHRWFLGGPGRDSDAAQVRALATDAMRALVVNLRRIVGEPDRERSRQSDLLDLARRFDAADDATAHALWAAVFGLYPARHLGFGTGGDGAVDETPPTASWWRAPVADVPVSLVERGERQIRGRPSTAEDYSEVKRHRLAMRREQELTRERALAELSRHAGPLDGALLSDQARTVLLELHARALAESATDAGRSPAAGPNSDLHARYVDPGTGVGVGVTATPGRHTVIDSPDGRMIFRQLRIEVLVREAIGDGAAEDPPVPAGPSSLAPVPAASVPAAREERSA